jgi:hypothetical protein
MREEQKKQLYNNIMTVVAREVKNALKDEEQKDSVLNENDSTSKKELTVTINWSRPIDVEKLNDDELTKIEEEVASSEKIIYIFVGYNNKGEKAQDVGQTGRTLIARTKEHVRDKDFLEDYPNDRRVYSGEVTCAQRVNRTLLEQVEGAIIQYLAEDNGNTYLCNENKLESYTRTYNIAKIKNANRSNKELKRMLPEQFTPKNED